MSFSINLNSSDGSTVNGSLNQIQYNFAFDKTPEHKGSYKVYMSFASGTQAYPNFGSPNDIYINADLGVCNSFTPIGYTSTQNNQMLGVVRAQKGQLSNLVFPFGYDTTDTASIPVNSGTAAYTFTETITPADGRILYHPGTQAYSAKYNENRPIKLNTKPTNNQFIVKLSKVDGTLYTDFTATYYSMILTFEAV